MEHDQATEERCGRQRGASAVEYALLAAGILAVVIAALLLLSAHVHHVR